MCRLEPKKFSIKTQFKFLISEVSGVPLEQKTPKTSNDRKKIYRDMKDAYDLIQKYFINKYGEFLKDLEIYGVQLYGIFIFFLFIYLSLFIKFIK